MMDNAIAHILTAATTTAELYNSRMIEADVQQALLKELRGGPGCLNRFSASISGASARVRLQSGVAAG
jgi:hypothetical protein